VTAEQRTRGWVVHLALLGVQLAFASGAIAGKLVMNGEHVDPNALALIRALGGAVSFHAARIVLARGKPARVRIPAADHARFALYAILGVAVNQAFFLHGLKHASATNAALLAATIPVFTAGVAALARQERVTVRIGAGIAVATAGVLVLTGVRHVAIGNLLITINSLAYALYLVGIRKLLDRYGALVTIAWVFTYGVLFLAPFGLLPILREAASWSPRGLGLVAWFVAVPTIFAYLTNAFALSRARPSVVAAYIYLQPLLVMVFAGKLLGEAPSARTVVAGCGILLGVGIVATRRGEA
jgi:drug/metabolite transporter (DMT)-like permease